MLLCFIGSFSNQLSLMALGKMEQVISIWFCSFIFYSNNSYPDTFFAFLFWLLPAKKQHQLTRFSMPWSLSRICTPVISNYHYSQVSMVPNAPAFLNTNPSTNNPTAEQQQRTNQSSWFVGCCWSAVGLFVNVLVFKKADTSEAMLTWLWCWLLLDINLNEHEMTIAYPPTQQQKIKFV